MTNDTSTMSENSGRPAEDYRTSEGLRALLKRLHTAGQRAWEHDPVAAELMAWAVITHAVRITCIAEERGQGLLCSTHQARRSLYSIFHDPERLSDRENVLSDCHRAFQIKDAHDRDDTPEQAPAEPAATTAASAVEDAITLLMLLDWPEGTARSAVEHVCVALTRVGNRHTAYETLRRNKHARTLIDLRDAPGRCCCAMTTSC